jgi:hypothetical protein
MLPLDESAVAFPEQLQTVELAGGKAVEVRPDGTRYEAAAQYRFGVQTPRSWAGVAPPAPRC